MARYVLFSRKADPDPADVALIAEAMDVTVIDNSQRAILLEATEEAAARLKEALPDWVVAPEVDYERPGPARQEVR